MNENNQNEYHYKYNNGKPPVMPEPRKRSSPEGDLWSTLAWCIDIAAIFISGPVGLGLVLAKTFGHDFVGDFLRKTFRKPDAVKNPTAFVKTGTEEMLHTKPDSIAHADAGAKVKTVFGWILLVIGAAAVIGGALSGIGGEAAFTVWNFIVYSALALGGGALLAGARAGRRREAKFKRCLTVTGEQGIVDISKLVRTTGLNPAEAERLLTDMIDRGFYGKNAYIDHERGLLVVRPEEMRDVYRREDEEKARKADSAPTEAEDGDYGQYIRRLAHADELIEDESMSEKIRLMQELTASVFREVEAHPEKRSQIGRFLNYYLPTTLKLLDSYARIEKQGVTGENTAKAKADIEGIADTLVQGYRKQLDTLYRSEAADIAGDVSILEKMMKDDGLTGDRTFGTEMGGH